VFNDSTFVGLQLHTKAQSSFVSEMLGRVLRTCMKFYAFEMHVYAWALWIVFCYINGGDCC